MRKARSLSWIALATFILSVASLSFAASASEVRPWAEYEKVRYLVIGWPIYPDEPNGVYQHLPVIKKVLKHLPAGVDVIVIAPGEKFSTYVSQIKASTKDVISFNRIRIWSADEADQVMNDLMYFLPDDPNAPAKVRPTDSLAWARDYLPFPLVHEKTGRATLFGWHYWHTPAFRELSAFPRFAVRPYQRAKVSYAPVQFEFGNFMSNDRGNCFAIGNEFISAELLKEHLACKTAELLPFVRGIGHVDERAKFIDATTIATDTEEYVPTFEKLGFKVVRLPAAGSPTDPNYPLKDLLQSYGSPRTYVNSLIVNGVAYVPTFNDQGNDDEALRIYRSLGFEAVSVPSEPLFDYGWGGIHCITMTWPELPLFNSPSQSR